MGNSSITEQICTGMPRACPFVLYIGYLERVKEEITDNDILLKFSARDYPKPNYLLMDCDERRLKICTYR